MKVLVKAMAAGAIGCAGLLPATSAHAQAGGDPLPHGRLRQLGSAVSMAGLGGGLFDANRVDAQIVAPVNICDNSAAILGTATAGSTGNEAGADARAPMRSHGEVGAPSEEKTYTGGTSGY